VQALCYGWTYGRFAVARFVGSSFIGRASLLQHLQDAHALGIRAQLLCPLQGAFSE
jgi:hypothetical protein